MSAMRRFVCSGPLSSTVPFEKEIPTSLVERSDFLQLAVSEADDDDDAPVQLVLPSEIDSSCVDSWLQLNDSTAQATHLDSQQDERTPPETLLEALRVADFLADDVSLDIIYRRLACHLFCARHGQEGSPRDAQPRKRQKLSITNESVTTCKQVSRPMQKQRTANKKILQHIPSHVALSILAKGSFLVCIRCLPPAYHALAIEAHHHEVVKAQRLSLSRERQSCDDSVRSDVFTAVAAHSQLTSLHLHGYWISQCKPVIQRRLCAMFESLSSLRELQFPDGVNSATATVLIDSAEVSALASLEVLEIIGDPSCGSMQSQNLPPQELNSLLHSLREVPALHSLTLHAFKRDSDEIVEFCSALKHLTNLTKLDLSSCFLRGNERFPYYGARRKQIGDGLRVTQRLGGALKKLKLLEHLDLSNSFPEDYIEPVFDAIASLTKLTLLKLNDMNTMACMRFEFPHNVPLNIGYGKRLVPMLQRFQQLKSINLSSYPMFEDVWAGFGSALANLTQLTMLYLEHVAKSADFWESVFCPNVTYLVNLKTVSLSRNSSINDANVWTVGKALSELPVLDSLWMSTCDLKREGALALSEHLKGMTGLTQLALKENRIGPQGAKAIADSLRKMPNIKALRFTFKCIGLEGAGTIKCALEAAIGPEWEEDFHYHCGIEPGYLGQDWEASDAEGDEGMQAEWHQWHAAEMAGLFQNAPVPQLHIALHWFQAMVMEAMI